MRGARRACGAGASASVRGPFGLPSMLGRCGPARQLGPAGLRHASLFARIALRVWAPHRRRRTRTAHPALWAHGRSHASVTSKRACVLVAQACADVQVERSCSGKEPALNSVDGGLALAAPSPTLLLLLHAQEQPRAQLGEVRIGCEPGAAFLLRDNSLAQPTRFIADTSARRRGSRPGPSNAKARSAGKTSPLVPRLRGDDDLGDSARPRPRFPAFAGMTIWATQQDLAPGSPPSRG